MTDYEGYSGFLVTPIRTAYCNTVLVQHKSIHIMQFHREFLFKSIAKESVEYMCSTARLTDARARAQNEILEHLSTLPKAVIWNELAVAVAVLMVVVACSRGYCSST